MWEETVIRLICFSLCGGILYGVIDDVFFVASYFFAKVIKIRGDKIKTVIVAIRDLVLGIVAGCILLLSLYYGNSGRFRLSCVAFALLSYTAYRLSVGKLVRFVARRFIDAMLELADRILNIVKRAWNFFFGRIRKITETYKNKRRLRIEKHKDNKLRRSEKRCKRVVYRGKPRVAGECEECT